MSYPRTREIVLQAFVELGYPKNYLVYTVSLAIGVLSVVEGGKWINLKTVILRIKTAWKLKFDSILF